MKVLVSDNIGEAGVEIFQLQEGIDVDVKTDLTKDELKQIIGEYDALAIRSETKVTKEILDAATRLKVIARAGIGLDNVDIDEATKKGVAVMNTPGGNTVTSAEHAIAMMMAMSRNIPRGTQSMKAGKWEKHLLQGTEICNKIFGVIGFGNIGSRVASLAKGLRMKVIVFDPNISSEHIKKAGFEYVSLEQLYERSDYISIHVPKIDTTIDLLDFEAFNKMKKGVMIINCASGGIVNESALYDAVLSGTVAGAALDVFSTEPPGDHPLLKLDQVIATPHIGAFTKEAQTNVAVAAANQIIAYLLHGTVMNAVNVPSVSGELLKELKPFLYLAGKMGKMMAQITKGGIRQLDIEYIGKFPDLDLKPVTISAINALLAHFVQDEVNSVNAITFANEMGIKISESTSKEAGNFLNLIRVTAVTDEETNLLEGTIFGKDDARIVRINKFRLEVIPEGHLGLIHNLDKPGSIGSMGITLGKHNINICRMMVGREEDGDRNIIFLETDTPVPPEVIKEIEDLELVISMKTFEL
ncbi:phosphoglycerate dehydrogenase [Desulfobacula toluolica]|uniref:D-3-phosphoglycerate dehydrogenase n=1 Tax=Desulfobacula toluolica (strain DSM 7467 / Tol2) TaxID=651182 RepID=K0NJK5_DESTT|nr:phosphoglycerate dehydrogenase [Desulfobacula toluolica]CCK80038.1 SerA: D-3-phosphoglycerate dehydrogenase [Desulfobacula toluolica Tol2]